MILLAPCKAGVAAATRVGSRCLLPRSFGGCFWRQGAKRAFFTRAPTALDYAGTALFFGAPAVIVVVKIVTTMHEDSNTATTAANTKFVPPPCDCGSSMRPF